MKARQNRTMNEMRHKKNGCGVQNNSSRSLLERFCTAFVAVLFFAILLFLLYLSITSTCAVYGGSEILEYGPDYPLVHILFWVLTAGAGIFMKKKNIRLLFSRTLSEDEGRSSGYAGYLRLFVMAAGFYVLWLLLTGYWVGSDQRMAVESGQALIRGDFSPWEPHGFTYSSPMTPRGYAYTYPSQNGLILYFAFLAFFFRELTPYAAQVFNIGFVLMGMYCLCRLFELAVFSSGGKKTGKNARQNTRQNTRQDTRQDTGQNTRQTGGTGGLLLLLLFYLPFTFYFTFVYGTVPGFALSTYALYSESRFLRTGKWNYFYRSAAAIILAVFLKSNYLIVLAAMVIYLLSSSIFRRRAGYFAAAALMLVLYTGAGKCMNSFLESVTTYPVSQGAPMIAWVEMGLREGSRGPGWYNGYNVSIFSKNNLDPAQTSEAVKEDLRETLAEFAQDPKSAADFFVRKSQTIWAEPTFQSLWIQEVKGDSWLLPSLTQSLYDKGGLLNILYLTVANLFQSLVYFGAILYLILYKKKLTWEQLMPAVIFIGGFLFHLAWEAKGQYTVCYFILLIPYAWAAFSKFIDNPPKI